MLPPLPLADGEQLEAVTDNQEAIKQEAVQQVRARFKLIVTSSEAQGRSRLALYLATDTDLSPEAARAILAATDREVTDAPKDKPTANFFEQHRADNPDLWNLQPPLSVAETIARMTRNYAAVTGLEVKPK
jgi:thioredoxin-like negative regulator of GroEL